MDAIIIPLKYRAAITKIENLKQNNKKKQIVDLTFNYWHDNCFTSQWYLQSRLKKYIRITGI